MDLAGGTIFLAGLATFASPCVLPMIPIYLSVLLGGSLESEAKGLGRLRLLANGGMFVLGFTLVFVLLGLTATALGRFLIHNRLLIQQLGGLLVFMFGLKFLGWLRIEALDREKRIQMAPGTNMSPFSAFAMGLTFAFGWTPCIGPVLGAVLTYTAVSTDSVSQGAFNLFLYAAGVGLPLLMVAVLAQPGVRLLNKVKRFLPKLEKATGLLLLTMAILMVTDNTSLLTFGVSDAAATGISKDVVAATEDPANQRPDAAACDTDATACGIGEVDENFTAEPIMETLGPGSRRVVYFYQPNCPACLKMAPVVQSMNQTCSGRGLDVRKVDVSKPTNRRFAADHGVRGTPTLLFLDEAGEEVARLIGAVDFDAVHGAVGVLMGEVCADFTSF